MRRSVVPMMLVAALAACASPSPRFYSLADSSPPAGASASAQVKLALVAVTVPDAVDRPQLVVRQDGALRIMEQRRWLQPLRSDIAMALATRLGMAVAGPGQAAGQEAVYRLTVDIQRFDSTLGGPAALEALWTLTRAGGAAVDSGRVALSDRAADGSYDALVAAHGRMLAELATRIAAAVPKS
ncbi:PqiC family protein [Microvirgula curvata]